MKKSHRWIPSVYRGITSSVYRGNAMSSVYRGTFSSVYGPFKTSQISPPEDYIPRYTEEIAFPRYTEEVIPRYSSILGVEYTEENICSSVYRGNISSNPLSLGMCTLEKRGNLFILTLTGKNNINDEHTLSPARALSICAALAEAKSQAVDGSALITLAPGKFFCNGVDLKTITPASFAADVLHCVEHIKAVGAEMMALPMPTIAAVTGHISGSGALFAMLHDYVVMTSSKGVIYMSEMDIGMSLPDIGAALLRAKVGSASARRDLVLGTVKVRGEAAVSMGIVDRVYDSEEEVVGAAMRMGEEMGKKGWCGKAYGENRKLLYPEFCEMLGLKHQVVFPSKI
ncbi:hypothetical protein CASFOL_005201 [Castilleja foliolosa]|uniref:Delta(3)-Delta(2)-enoyl-CoA isomerase n=1 Tax=Castilleja foliolosa TaxID=1961234 RepID=A0ABD3E335_9LAMI